MNLRLYDEVVPGIGVPGGYGPLTCAGYYDDPSGNEKLYAPDGAMLMGDLVSIDDEGYVSVVGRTSDIIIRGGKNISAVQVESAVDSHPRVTAVGIVAVADAVFGERVCAVVTLVPGTDLTLADLAEHLAQRGLGKELWPEHLLILDDLPRSSGGKLAKAELRQLAEAALQHRPGIAELRLSHGERQPEGGVGRMVGTGVGVGVADGLGLGVGDGLGDGVAVGSAVSPPGSSVPGAVDPAGNVKVPPYT